jgi:hypothetical protein
LVARPFFVGRVGATKPVWQKTDFMLSEAALKEFKQIYFAEYGTELSDSEAADLAINFLTFMNAVYRPVKKEWLDKK